jgi:oligopeptide/dipeptide ABC transporter ATP-binding protein
MTAPLLQVDDLQKDYPAPSRSIFGKPAALRVLDGVSLQIDEQETLGLVGESGSGKSTTGRLILRLIPTTGGTVRFEGRDILSLSPTAFRPYRKSMQIIFQDPGGAMNPVFRVETVIGEALRVHFPDMDRAARRGRVVELLEQVGLRPEAADRYPHEFSGGQLQRIGIARALAVDPKLIIADEPVSALDVSVQAQVLNLLSDLKDSLGLSCLFIAHDLAVVKRMSQRVAVMYRGRIVETASSADIYRDPAHPYTRLLLEAIPRVTGRRPDPAPAEVCAPDLLTAPEGGCPFARRCPIRAPICLEAMPDTKTVAPGHTVACHRA